MKINIFFISAFFGMLILSSSCSDDDDRPIPRNDSWYWGYFKGTINEKEFTLINKAHGNEFVTSIGHNLRYLNEPDSIRGLLTAIEYSEIEGISVNLFHLHKGVRYITMGQSDLIDNSIMITRSTPKDINGYNGRIFYIPKKEKPFRVEVIKTTYEDNWYPIIEAELDGVLYRSDNHKDSIIIKATYGTRAFK